MADADLAKPQLGGLILPGTIDVSGGDGNALFTASASDVGSGVDRVSLVLDRSYQSPYGLTTVVTISGDTDTFADGVSTVSTLFKATTGAGVYKVENAIVYDKAGNYTVYNSQQLSALGAATSFTVISKTAADLTKPVLSALVLPSTIDISSGDVSAAFKASASDTGSGVDRVSLVLDRNYQSTYGLTTVVTIGDEVDTFADGSSTGATLFKATTGAGAYKVESAIVYDKAGNYTVYSAEQLSALGIATSFTVASNTSADTAKPTLTALTLPSTIDVSKGDVSASFKASASDVGSGVDRVSLVLDRNFQSTYGLTSVITIGSDADTFADGASTTSTLFKAGTGAGAYKVESAIVYDKAGNYTVYSAQQLTALGLATGFTVQGGVAGAGIGFAADNPGRFVEGGVANVTLSLPAAGAYSIRLDITATLPSGTSTEQRTVTFTTISKTYSFSVDLPQDAGLGDGTLKIVLSRLDGGFIDNGRDVFTATISNDDSSAFTVNTTNIAAAYRNIARVEPSAAVLGDQKFLGEHSARDDVRALWSYVAGTTSVAVTAYQFFTGKTPSAGGLDYLIDPAKNANALNSPYYAGFNTENRYINFAANLGLHGEASQTFNQKYGSLSFHDALVLAYQDIIGAVRPDAIASIETALPYFQLIARERMADSNQDLATKAAAIGYLLQEAVKAHVGVYAQGLENFYLDLADGSAQHNVDLVGVYGPGAFMDGVA